MKIAFIADIHGNYPALKAVLSECRRMNCEKVLSLGDLAGYYCMLNECATLCRENQVISLLGNHDNYLLTNTDCPRSTTANVCLDWQKKHVTSDTLDYMASFAMEFHNSEFYGVHGGWNDPLDEYINDFNFHSLPDKFCSLFCSAHTHIQKLTYYKSIVYFNPGSVGQPRDSDPRAAFAVLENGEVELHRVSYDIDEIAFAMRKVGFDLRYYENLYLGLPIATYKK